MQRRRKNFEEAKKNNEIPSDDDLAQAIMSRRAEREEVANDFFAALEAKYASGNKGTKKKESRTSSRNKKQKTDSS